MLFFLEDVADSLFGHAHGTTFFLHSPRLSERAAEVIVVAGYPNIRQPPYFLCAVAALHWDDFVSHVKVHFHSFFFFPKTFHSLPLLTRNVREETSNSQ